MRVSTIYINTQVEFCVYLRECNIAAFNYNFEIRVGRDGVDIGQNQLCYKQVPLMAVGEASFPCLQNIFGEWISFNKSTTDSSPENLVIQEMHVFVGDALRITGDFFK